MSTAGNAGCGFLVSVAVAAVRISSADAAGYRPPPAGQPPATALTWTSPRPPPPRFDTAGGASMEIGGLHADPALAVYLVVGNAPARGRALIRNAKGDCAMLRVFDADERLTHWQYVEPGLEAPICHPRDAYVDGLPPPVPADAALLRGALLDAHFALVGRGVHQVRVQTGVKATDLRLVLTAALPFGVSFQNGHFSPWRDCPERLYACVPPRAEELTIACVEGAVRVLDERDRVLREASDKRASTLNVERTDCVWTFEFPEKVWRFRAWGFPLILCTTPEAARAIRASAEVLPDGSVVSHKFQRRIAELLPGILAPENVGAAEALIVPLASRQAAWLRDPLRNVKLFGYGTSLPKVAYALRRQNVDPADPWGGLFFREPKPNAAPKPRPRWDGFLPVGGFGDRAHSSTPAALAKAALLDEPINPYYGKRELLFRAAAACLRDLLALSEAEVWRNAATDPYPSGMSFQMGQKDLPPFGLAAPHLPEAVRAIWTEGVRHMVDRTFTDRLVSCRNQSSHQLVSYAEFARGAQDPVYDRLSRLFARRFAAGAHPAGYHEEATGPCGSYIGMTHWHMAVYYRLSGDREFLDSIRNSYRFFNHTVAPEPGGGVLGGFNFNHRVSMGFFQEQWSGAKGILDDVLPEVGLWAAGPPGTPESRQRREERAREQILKGLKKTYEEFPGQTGDPRFEYDAEPDKSGIWPACEPQPFTRTFADQLLAVKRPGYYAVIYIGKPMAEWAYRRNHPRFRKPMPDDAENTGKPIKEKYVLPFLGGGLSLFWTPDYGAAVMAANWSALMHHGLVAFNPDGTRDWEDYYATAVKLDEPNGRLTVTGRIAGLPLRYTRRYRFEPEQLAIELTVAADADVSLMRLIENVPLAGGKRKKRGAELSGPHADEAAPGMDFTVMDSASCGVRFELAAPRPLRVCRTGPLGKYGDYRINRVEIELPATLKQGEAARLAYRLTPVRGPVSSPAEP
ncbi:MAG: hypothetical protein JXR37_16580 [Kiritimatiellae bacterium]|nr:hypothetical protein [Kiritimatiellia bacterium]